MPIRRFLLAAIAAVAVTASPALAGTAAAPGPLQYADRSAPEGSAARKTPCQCRFNGRYFQQGEQVCIRGQMAECGMYLNNTSWKFSTIPCPLARADGAYPLR